MKTTELTPALASMLSLVRQHGPCTLGQLAHVSGLPKQSIRDLLRKLKNMGLAAKYTVPGRAAWQVTEEGDWREAIGCAPAKPGSISPEEAIRRIR